jgi:excisionase family DNA binding protein
MNLLTPDQTAAFLQIKKTHLYSLVSRKKIPYTKIGQLLRFNKEHLSKWITENTVGK